MVSVSASLKNAEAAAIRNKKEQSLLEREESPESSDSFSYKENPSNARMSFEQYRDKKSKKKKSKLLTLAPLAVFLVLVFGVGALLSVSTSLLPGHIDSNGQKSWDVQYPAMKLGLKLMTKNLLSTGSLPSGFADRLADSGIEVGFLDTNNNFIAGLRPTSENSIALASEKSSSPSVTDSSLVLRWKDKILTADDFASYLEADPTFYSAFSDATYGRAAGHYDSSANNFYSNLEETRNVFEDYTSTGDNKKDTEAFQTKLSELFSPTTASSAHTFMDVTENLANDITYAHGTQPKIYGCYNGATKIHDNRCNSAEIALGYRSITIPSSACDKYGEIYGVSVRYDDGTCYAETASGNASASTEDSYLTEITYRSLSDSQISSNEKAVSLINTAVNANESYQSMKFFLTIEEAISKMKAGEGSTSPINQVLNFLTTSTTTDYGTGAPVQAPGLAAVLTGNFSDDIYEDTSAYSLDRFISAAGEVSGSSVDKSLSKIAVSTKYNSDSKNLIQDFGNFFVGQIENMTSAATTGFIASLNPKISQSLLFTDTSSLTGLAAGEVFARGGSALGGNIAKFTQGGTIGDESSILAYQKTTDRILALDAAAARATLSPLDYRNENTFLGSIVSSFGNIFLTSDSFLSSLSAFSTLTSSSLRSLLPSALAAGVDENSYQTTFAPASACPALSSSASTLYSSGAAFGIEEKADYYCNPLITFDTDTIESALNTPEFTSFLDENLQLASSEKSSSSSTYEAVPGSDLDLFMKYNNGRQSTFAVKNSNTYREITTDNNIKNSINDTAGSGAKNRGFFGKLWKSVKGFFGKIGNFFSQLFTNNVLDAGLDEIDTSDLSFSDRLDRISTGEEFANSPTAYWDTYKYAQAYITYSRVLDQLGYYSVSNTNPTSLSAYFVPGTGENPVASAIASYTKAPEDESDAEYLSRISGLTLDESDFVLGYVAYNSYLASLDYDSYQNFTEIGLVATLPTFLTFDNSLTPDETPAEKKSILLEKKRRESTYAI